MVVTRRARSPTESKTALQQEQAVGHLLLALLGLAKGRFLPNPRRPCSHIGRMQWPPLAESPFASGVAVRHGTIGKAASGED